MPYEWTTQTARSELSVWPHRSLPKEGFVWFIGGTATMIALPLIAVLGSPVLWALLPFLAVAVWGVWFALKQSYRDGQTIEHLTLTTDQIHLVRHNPRGPAQHWQANPHWVRVNLHPDSGPVENYLTLKGGGRDVELGAFLSPEERKSLYDDLTRRLLETRTHV